MNQSRHPNNRSPSPVSDAYYTPFPIALRLAIYARSKNVRRILDPACGDGSLLLAASQRWPDAELIANDISFKARANARSRLSLASTSSLDILRVAADAGFTARMRRQWNADLILLNPPFSARSTHRYPVAVGIELRAMVSQAASFVLGAAQLLRPGAEMIAVMPASFLSSSRDQIARNLLERLGDVEIVERLPRKAFRGCRAASVILRFARQRAAASRFYAPPTGEIGMAAAMHLVTDFIRGNVRVHDTKDGHRGRRRFLHTTHLQDERAAPVLRSVPVTARIVRGHAVLMPRVGCVPSSKVVVACFHKAVVLSDCIFALRTTTANDARRLQKAIVSNWRLFEAEYVGTGAPHLRADSLFNVLQRIRIPQKNHIVN